RSNAAWRTTSSGCIQLKNDRSVRPEPTASPARTQPYQKNFVGRLISGGRLLCTGQLRAVRSRTSRCGEFAGSGIWTSEGSATIRRGASFDIFFFTSTVMPFRLTPSSSAFIPMVVLIQVPSAVATRSVGENASPLPLLSVGASVATFACEGPWVASQWRSPVYLIEMLTISKYLPLICHVERGRDISRYFRIAAPM